MHQRVTPRPLPPLTISSISAAEPEPMKGYGVIEDRSLWLRPKFGRLGEIRLNPVVYVLSLSIIIAFVVWTMIFPSEAKEEFVSWKVGISRVFFVTEVNREILARLG